MVKNQDQSSATATNRLNKGAYKNTELVGLTEINSKSQISKQNSLTGPFMREISVLSKMLVEEVKRDRNT